MSRCADAGPILVPVQVAVTKYANRDNDVVSRGYTPAMYRMVYDGECLLCGRHFTADALDASACFICPVCHKEHGLLWVYDFLQAMEEL